MENLPVYISLLFGIATALTVWFLFKASGNSRKIVMIVITWIGIQTIISLSGFYKLSNTAPPRFALLVVPTLVFIALLFLTAKGRRVIDGFDLKWLTILHSVRILVELVLLLLCINHVVPQLMTFEGMNFDIISGITAPVVYYLGFIKGRFNKKFLLAWNIICLGLLLNVVIRALLSVPTPFQQFGFEQPNIAILYFPFVWLPCFIVPVVLFSHLAAIRQLLRSK